MNRDTHLRWGGIAAAIALIGASLVVVVPACTDDNPALDASSWSYSVTSSGDAGAPDAGCGDAGGEADAFEGNNAGCDGIGGSCGDYGACCDEHDSRIGDACPFDCLSVLSVGPEHDPPANPNPCNNPDDPIWDGYDYEECHDAHDDVMACVWACRDLNFDGEPDGGEDCPEEPSECCNEEEPEKNYCGYPQACYDDETNEPIYDPCECEDRELESPFECECDSPGEQGEGDPCSAFCGCADGLSCGECGTCQSEE